MAVSVAYPGRDGAHSAAACDRLFPEAELVALPSFHAVVEAAAEGAVEFGVLPIESSLSGPVAETHDLLYESPLAIVGETVLPIRHCLVGVAQDAAGGDPRRALAPRGARPVPPAARRDAMGDRDRGRDDGGRSRAGRGARRPRRGGDRKRTRGSPARSHGDRRRCRRPPGGVHALRLDRDLHAPRRERGSWRTAFSFVTDHQPGALHRAIEPFARHGIDLAQLVSRPIPHTPFRYRFDAVLAGHPLDPVISEALVELGARTRRLRVFGSYPAHDE